MFQCSVSVVVKRLMYTLPIVLEKEEKNKNNYTLNLMVWLSFTLLIFAQVSWYGLSLSRLIFSRNIDRILVAIV